MLTALQIGLPIAGASLAFLLALVARVLRRPLVSRAGRWIFFVSLAVWPVFTLAIIVQAIIDPSVSIGVTRLDSANAAASLSTSPATFLVSAANRLAVAAIVFVLAWHLVKPPRPVPDNALKN